MKKILKTISRGKRMLTVCFLLAFCMLGIFVLAVSRRISNEMSQSAIYNLSESLNLVSTSMEAILEKEAEFQELIAREVAKYEQPEEFILSYAQNNTMVKISLIPSGETAGISNTGDAFTEEGLDFSGQKTVLGFPLSASYVNSMGTWAYTIKCPVVKGGETVGELYIEYIYDSFSKVLPGHFYNNEAKLYLMDAASERLVLKPKGMGERDAGHMNLEDFYHANKIAEEDIKKNVEESIKAGKDVMFYHDILNEASLIYMWSVNEGSAYLIGYVPIHAIQREGDAVNQNMFIVVIVMLAAFFSISALYLVFERQHDRLRREREAERELHNNQLKEALQAAQVANQSKTMFLSNMSHDIRTPMNAILGFATLLAKDADNPERVRDYTGKISSSGQHLLGLINDILDISKIESGKMVLNISEFAVSDMISSVDAIIRPAAAARSQNFHITVKEVKHARLLGDETRINQILLNLLSNAVKYTQEGGRIDLRVTGLEQQSNQCEHLRIEVEDNGYGMTPEYLAKLFDAFTRAENSTTKKVQGTGLGMAITKNIVELMGGTIDVSSEAGTGTLFTVELTLRIPEGETAEKEKKQPELTAASLEMRHFLVAEDNEINAEILSEILQMEGASCEIVENGQAAVERFEQMPAGSFDAILMDVQMPVMNGYDAAKAIRSSSREDAGLIPIIAMTANAFTEDVKNAMDAGMNGHVAKPIDIEHLRKTIGQCLRQ